MKIEDPLLPQTPKPVDARKPFSGVSGLSDPDKGAAAPDRPSAATASTARNEVTLSPVARQMSAEPVWSDNARLVAIQDAVRQGKYHADPAKIADKLISSVGELLFGRKA